MTTHRRIENLEIFDRVESIKLALKFRIDIELVCVSAITEIVNSILYAMLK